MAMRENSRKKPKAALAASVSGIAIVAALLVLLWLPNATPIVPDGPDSGDAVTSGQSQTSDSDFIITDGAIAAREQASASELIAQQPEPDPGSASSIISSGEDGITAEHEAGVVVVQLDEGADATAVTRALAQLSELDSPVVTSDDIVAGYAALPVAANSNVKAAMAARFLERDEERTLAENWRYRGDEHALHELAAAHMRLVIALAARFRHYGLPLADLIQEGHVGLLEAAGLGLVVRDIRVGDDGNRLFTLHDGRNGDVDAIG